MDLTQVSNEYNYLCLVLRANDTCIPYILPVLNWLMRVCHHTGMESVHDALIGSMK